MVLHSIVTEIAIVFQTKGAQSSEESHTVLNGWLPYVKCVKQSWILI